MSYYYYYSMNAKTNWHLIAKFCRSRTAVAPLERLKILLQVIIPLLSFVFCCLCILKIWHDLDCFSHFGFASGVVSEVPLFVKILFNLEIWFFLILFLRHLLIWYPWTDLINRVLIQYTRMLESMMYEELRSKKEINVWSF